MVEGRGRPAGTTLESAKGQTQRWQPLLPNLQRVNAAALATGRTRFTALLHHVDVAALERAFRRQRRAASPGVDRVTMDQYEQDLAGNLQRLHARVHSGRPGPSQCSAPTSRKPMEANGLSACEGYYRRPHQACDAHQDLCAACLRQRSLYERNSGRARSRLETPRWRQTGRTHIQARHQSNEQPAGALRISVITQDGGARAAPHDAEWGWN